MKEQNISPLLSLSPLQAQNGRRFSSLIKKKSGKSFFFSSLF